MKTYMLGTVCYYCSVHLTRSGTRKPSSWSRDHLIPKSRGGSNHPSNIVPCCLQCNNEKGSMTADEYIAWRRAGRPKRKQFMKDIAVAAAGIVIPPTQEDLLP